MATDIRSTFRIGILGILIAATVSSIWSGIFTETQTETQFWTTLINRGTLYVNTSFIWSEFYTFFNTINILFNLIRKFYNKLLLKFKISIKQLIKTLLVQTLMYFMLSMMIINYFKFNASLNILLITYNLNQSVLL